MKTITPSALRSDLYNEMNRIVDDAEPTLIVRSGGDNLVLMSEAELNSILETMHLLQDPENARVLMRAKEQLESGNGMSYDMSEFGL